MKIKFVLPVLSLLFIVQCRDFSTIYSANYESITLDEIYHKGIINFVNKEINLKSKVYWHSSNMTFDGPSDTTFAGLLRLKFENGDNYIDDPRFKNQERGNLFVVSKFIEKRVDDNFTEKYYFKEDSLSNSKMNYILKGKIQFRKWLKISRESLNDSLFIKQCNNVVYWSQTFEFEVGDILATIPE